MLEKLTQEQIDLIPVYRDKWLKIGLDTTPLNKDKVREAIDKVYECADLDPPKVIIYTESPYHLALLYTTFKPRIYSENSLTLLVSESIKASVYRSIRNVINDPIYDFIDDNIYQSLTNSITTSTRNHIWDNITNSVSDSMKEFVFYYGLDICYGQHDISILGKYNFYDEVLGLREETKILDGLMMAAKECGWFTPFKDICIVSEKPSKILFKENIDGYHIIHSDNEPAIFYNEDFKIYVCNGIVSEDSKSHIDMFNPEIIIKNR